MRPVSWLHISDFHLRNSQAWAQDVVLSAMSRDIAQRRLEVGSIDFVLVTGDLAFSGKAPEYDLAGQFFDEVTRVAGVPRSRIFCTPGNHDVDHNRQTTCFIGALQRLQSQNDIDCFLASPEELQTLLLRQQDYHQFQRTFFSAQERVWTSDGLAYVSILTVQDLRIAIVAINTAWLAEGGSSDHGRLIAGERQVIDALDIATHADTHLIIAIGHHPFHLLRDFDRRVVQRRIEETCNFYHCGHLHDPELHDPIYIGAHCLTITTGSSFESRHTHNAYCLVNLDVIRAQQITKTFRYQPIDDAFSYQSERPSPFIINTVNPYPIDELGPAIFRYCSAFSHYYLAALLIEAQTEIPIAVGSRYIFGSLDLLRGQAESELKARTLAFMNVRNPLRMFGRRMSIVDFLTRYGEPIAQYGILLERICAAESGLRTQLEEREANGQALAGLDSPAPFAHSLALLRELASDHDWQTLRANAERYLDSPEKIVAIEARRMLALCISQTTEHSEKSCAIALYDEICTDELAEAADFASLASLLVDARDYEAAKKTTLAGIERFPDAIDGFLPIGQRIVEATGDRAFRDILSAEYARRREE